MNSLLRGRRVRISPDCERNRETDAGHMNRDPDDHCGEGLGEGPAKGQRKHDKIHKQVNRNAVRQPAEHGAPHHYSDLPARDVVDSAGHKRDQEMQQRSQSRALKTAFVGSRAKQAAGD